MPCLLLGVLEHIYILGDALDIEVIVLHFVVQCQKVEGVTNRAPRLEVRKEVLWCNLSVERIGVPKQSDTCVGDDGEDE